MAEQDVEVDLNTGEEIERVETSEVDQGVGDTDDVTPEQASSDDDHDDHDDVDADAGGTDDEREALRARRRDERKHRKQAQREREDTLRRELAARDAVINEMRGRLDAIDRRNNGSELAQIQQAKRQISDAYSFYKEKIKVATEANNGAEVADATEKMIAAQRKFDELNAYERAYSQRGATPQPLDPRLINNAQKWMDSNRWYDPGAKDPDSKIVMAIDQQLADENWNPTTEEYWKELDARVKKYLPHKASSGRGNNGSRPKSVVTGSGREGSSGGKSTYTLSADRVMALKEAGLWEDPKQRAEAIKRYREYDKQAQQNR